MPRKRGAEGALPRLGKLEPRYFFFLNPYTDARFTSCPQCGKKTRVRKLPIVVHIDPSQFIALNKVCRLCIPCDLLIVHQDELEQFLAAYFGDNQPEMMGNRYMVLGTKSPGDWRSGAKRAPAPGNPFETMHDFRDLVTFKAAPRWGPA